MNINWSRPAAAGRLSLAPYLEPLDLPPLLSLENCGGVLLFLGTLAFYWWQRNWGPPIVFLWLAVFHSQREYWRRRKLLPTPTAPTAAIPARSADRQCYQCTVRNIWELPLWLAVLALMLAMTWRDMGHFGGLTALCIALFIAAALYPLRQPRVRYWWRYRYDPASDCFLRERAVYLGRFREVARLPAADFCGLYWARRPKYQSADGPPDYFTTQLWLAGQDGREDVLLGEFTYWHRDNQWLAQRLTAGLSRASGLPQLYRWPPLPVLSK